MKTTDVEILIIPGWSSSSEDHWQSRWERNLRTARRIEQDDWIRPKRDKWTERILLAIAEARLPPVLVAHSLGVAAVVHAAKRIPQGLVAAAFLVAPADVESADKWPITLGETFDLDGSGFAPLPQVPLPFPSTLVASASDPYCTLERAKVLAEAWGSKLVEVGDAGHINTASGHGPWPDGLLYFGGLLRRIST
jgi:hypothetical protein